MGAPLAQKRLPSETENLSFSERSAGGRRLKLERAKGFEPSTPTLARLCSTPELHPHPSGSAGPRGICRIPIAIATASSFKKQKEAMEHQTLSDQVAERHPLPHLRGERAA